MRATGTAPVRRFGPWPRELRAFAELFALTGLAIAQPTFDLLGKNARLFVAWKATTADALLLVAVVLVVPALAGWALEVAVGLAVPRWRRAVHVGLAAAIVGLIAVEVLKRPTGLGEWPLVALGVVAALVGAALLWRTALSATFLRFLAIAPVVFALMFLVVSPARAVVFAREPGPADVPVGAPHRVVMVVLDELPLESLLDGQGHVDAELFPNFAALAGTSTWYRNETTVAPYTEAAVPAILSGELPSKTDAVPVAADHPNNLFTLLGRRYDLNVHESISRLCPTSLCAPTRRPVGLHDGFGGMVQDVTSIWRAFADPGQPSRTDLSGFGGEDFRALDTGTEFVRSLTPAERPRLDFLHVLLPHFPWHYLGTGQDYAAFPALPPGLIGPRWRTDDTAAISRLRHLLQVQATDTLLGRVVARLREIGAYDDSLIVVTADHGVAFRGGEPFRGIDRSTAESILWTPLFVKAPGQRAGVVDDRPAWSVDVLPTIADHLDVRVPWKVDGRSLRAAPRAEGARPLFEWSSNVLRPRRGDHFLHFDGRTGFRRVLARAAAPGGGPAGLRLYRSGPFGALVGEPVAGRVIPEFALDDVAVGQPLRYQVVDGDAPRTPWVTIQATTSLGPGRTVAVAMNGVVAGLFATIGPPHDGRTQLWGMLAPSILRDGRNLVQAFVVEGTPANPRLRALRVGAE